MKRILLGAGAAGALALGSIASCTFAGLDDYEVATCDPAATSQATDVCDTIDSPDPCLPFQCEPATRRCVQRPRDDDRDGDPSLACGGSDCDDADESRAGTFAEACDGLDNDCDDRIDEDALVASSPESIIPGAPDWFDARVTVPWNTEVEDRRLAVVVKPSGTGTCIRGYNAGDPPSGAACTILDGQTAQPYQASIDFRSGVALTAWIDKNGCADGKLTMNRTSSLEGQSLAPAFSPTGCRAAAWPAVGIAPGATSSALLAWRDVSVRDAVTPESAGCAAEPRAPLRIAPITATDTIIPDGVVLGTTMSTRPASVVGLPGSDPRFLVADSFEGGIGIALVGGELDPVPPLTHVPGLSPRMSGVVLAVGAIDGSTVHVGVGIEAGCLGAQEAWFTEATVDLTTGIVAVMPAIRLDVGARTSFVSPGWSPGRGEWLVAWGSGDRVSARRVRVERGALAAIDDAPIVVASNGMRPGSIGVLRSLARSSDWNLSFFDGGSARGFSETVIGCGP